jgi:hypothetical protein
LVQALVFSLFVTLASPLIAQQPAPAASPQKSFAHAGGPAGEPWSYRCAQEITKAMD